MITSSAFAGRHYAVLGLARSGRATVDALLASGARVTAWDGNAHAMERVGREVDCAGLTFADLDLADLSQFESLVLSPGVPLNRLPLAERARSAGLEIIGDVELFARARADLAAHKVVGITGTNGKSTTTALIHHILHESGVPSLMGGNIGLPILAQEPLASGGVYVLELSSYQLDLTQSLDCEVAVLLNITPNHLDRYDGFEAYAASKARLFAMQSDGGVRVDLRADPGRHVVPAGYAQDEWPSLRGPHNQQNAAAAIAVCEALGLDAPAIASGLGSFSGLPHRMERVADKDGILFVNDSKATNPTAAAPALAAFPAIRWILGGQAKSDSLDECAPHFSNVRKAYTIGEASHLFARLLKPHLAVLECGALDVAVRTAASEAEPGETILLSPACASFDQFTDFEARGDAFRRAVEAL